MNLKVTDFIADHNIEIIKDIINDFDMPDNNERADTIKDLLENEPGSDLKEIGCGTNRIAFGSKLNSGIVIKIALDDRGIKDNNLEVSLSDMIDHKYITPCYCNNGIVSISKKIKVMSSVTMANRKSEVKEVLKELSKKFILNDVGFKEFLNWGVDPDDNRVKILDYAYLKPITLGMDFTCHYKINQFGEECGGQLAYTKNFRSFKCTKCGSKVSLSEIQDPLRMLSDTVGAVFSDSILNK